MLKKRKQWYWRGEILKKYGRNNRIETSIESLVAESEMEVKYERHLRLHVVDRKHMNMHYWKN